MELPDELRHTDLSRPHDSILYSNKVQPVSFSQQQVRFELTKQGIMNSNAIVEWAYTPVKDPATDWAFYPLNIGSMAQVSRAVLSTQSGRVILDNNHFSQREAVEASFRDGAYNRFVGTYLNLSSNTYRYCGPMEPANTRGCERFCGRPYGTDGVIDPTGATWTPNALCNLNAAVAPQTRISLQECFPFLYEHNLPVGIMETLYVDIYFQANDSEGVVLNVEGGGTWVAGGTIDQNSCYLLQDNIVYTSPLVMESIRTSQATNGGLNFDYTDYHTQIIAIPNGVAVGDQSFERELGCTRYLVNNIKNIELISVAGSNNEFYGRYYSDGTQSRHLQVVANEALLFPDNTASQAENYARLEEVYNHTTPYVPRVVFALDTTEANAPIPSVADQTYINNDMQAFMGGQLNTLGIDMKDAAGTGFRVGNTPLRLYYSKTPTITGETWEPGQLQYYFMEYERSFMIAPNGRVVVSDFI